MAKEQYIVGKHDDGHHDGKRAEIRHIMEKEDELREFFSNLSITKNEPQTNSHITTNNEKGTYRQ